MFVSKKLGYLPLLSLVLTTPSLAEENIIEEVTVTANRISGNLEEIGSSIEVITADDLALVQEFSVADALRQVAGVSLSRNGGLGGVTNVRVRGAEAGQAIVLINGVKVNDLSSPSGGYNFANIFTSNISQIEVLKGPQSTLYGSDAMGGVIYINTRANLADGETRISAYGEAGSYNTQRFGGSAAFNQGKFSGSVNVDYVNSDGISAADENAGNSESDPYDNLSVGGDIVFSLIDNAQTQLSFEAFGRASNANISFDSFDFFSNGYVDGDETEEVTDQQLGFKIGADFFGGKVKNTFNANWSDIDRVDYSSGVKSFEAFSRRENFELLSEIEASDTIDILLGGEIENNDIATESFGFWGSSEAGAADIKSMFSEVRYQPIAGLTITAGVRNDDHKTFGNHTSFRTTLAYKLDASGTLFRANYGEGFRAPSLYQLFSTYGDVGLKPEVSEGWEMGVEQEIADGISFSATYFETNTENQINFDLGTFKYANLDKTKIKGVEVRAKLNISAAFTLSANYTHLNAKDVALDAPLLRRPKNSFNIQANYQWLDGLSSTITMTHVGEQPDTSDTLAAFTVVDFASAWMFKDGFELYGRVENLMDKEYQEVTGFGTPDRSFYIGLRVKL